MDNLQIELAEMQLALTTGAVAVINNGIQVVIAGQGIQVPGQMDKVTNAYQAAVADFNRTCAGVIARLEQLRGPMPVEEMKAELELCKN